MTDISTSLVIFDCDGVLVDSESIAGESMREGLQLLGLEMSVPEIRRAFVGLAWPDVIARLEKMTGAPVPAGWREQVQLQDKAWFLEKLEPVPGVYQAVEHLNKVNMPFCVASSGDVAKMQVTLGITKLLPFFEEKMFSASMVERGKPFPDLFLHAARSMGHEATRCVVIEDSAFGVQAAKAAGMRALGYIGDPHSDAQAMEHAGATLFDDMAVLPDLI